MWCHVGIVRVYLVFLLFAVVLINVLVRYLCYVFLMIVGDLRDPRSLFTEFLFKLSALFAFEVSSMWCRSSLLSVVLGFWVVGFSLSYFILRLFTLF